MLNKKSCPLCLRVVSENTRAKIIQQLKKNPKNAGKIDDSFSQSQPTISYHLRSLEKLGVVLTKKKGREVFYYLNKKYPCKKCLIFKMPF